MKPKIPISVDEATGIWTTDDLAMMYVPRHFFNNLHLGIEEALGHEKYSQSLFKSGHKSAYYWCDQEAQTHDLEGVGCFEHYLERLSLRGWGQFSFAQQDIIEQGTAQVAVRQSVFTLHQQDFELEATAATCFMYAGWFAGAADWVMRDSGIIHESYESQCQSVTGGESCIFTITRV